MCPYMCPTKYVTTKSMGSCNLHSTAPTHVNTKSISNQNMQCYKRPRMRPYMCPFMCPYLFPYMRPYMCPYMRQYVSLYTGLCIRPYMYPLRTQPVPDRRDDAPVAPDPRDPPDSIWKKKIEK